INQNISSWGMSHYGRDYHTVAIFGSQSTGKSTLLNALFGTDFSIMNSSSGRSQTTLGTYICIWMGKSADTNILVMDIEGVDGQERGEDKLVERRSALFSLATAEVLVVNMHEVAIGLYNGANVELLKTVFEANLRLSKGKGNCKTLLFFVIRDCISQTPLAYHENKLRGNMTKIWDNIAKPEHLANSSFSDFFDCMVVGLPPKPVMPDQFNEATDRLRLRFTDPSDSNYVFKPCYHRGIPIDGFSHYASGIWASILLADNMLSIPSQQMLLAEHRCAELYTEAKAAFEQNTSAIKAQVNDGKVIDGLGNMVEKARSEAIAAFDANAKHYHRDVYMEMRGKLYDTFNEQLSIIFRSQVKNLAAKLAEQFDTEMMPLRANSADLFATKAGDIRQNILQAFEEATIGTYRISMCCVACSADHNSALLMQRAAHRYACRWHQPDVRWRARKLELSFDQENVAL
ncbi:RHD3/Sey1, partial [Thamnocephalis sphaerospora]